MPGRRPLVTFVALFAVPLPACLHVAGPPQPKDNQDDKKAEQTKIAARATDGPPRVLFAELPSRPGAVVPTKIAPGHATGATAQKPADPQPAKTGDPVQPAGKAPEPDPFPVHQVSQPPPEPPLVAAVRAHAEGRPDRAIEILRALDKPNQDAVLAVLPILARLGAADLNNDSVTVAALVDQLHAVAARLEPRAALRIDKVAFCNDVSGFGRFVPRPDNHPYRPNERAQLYLEVRNLGSQPTADGFVTHVHAAVEIKDAHGRLVEQIPPPPDDWRRRVPVVRFEKQLVSRTPLHDFHVLYLFPAPTTPGVYTVTVELRDATGRRTVRSQPTRFDVAGP
jgi:hypothetical protein